MSEIHFEVSKAFEKDGNKHLIGCISSNTRDLEGEVFPLSVLKSMAISAVGVPLATTHKRNPLGFDDIGKVEKAWLEDDTGKLFADFKLDASDRADKLFQAVQNGTTVGFSVGGEGTKFNRIYKSFSFDHIIPTTMAANPDTELYTQAVAKSFDDLINIDNLHTIIIEELSVDVCKALDKSLEKEMDITNMDKDVQSTTEVEVVEKAGKTHSAATVKALHAVKEAPDLDTMKSMIDDLLNANDTDADDTDVVAPTDAIVDPVVPGPSGDPVDDANPPSESDDILNPVIKEQIDVSVAKAVAEALPDAVEKEVIKRISDYKSAIEKIGTEVKTIVEKQRKPKEGAVIEDEEIKSSLKFTSKDAIKLSILQRLENQLK